MRLFTYPRPTVASVNGHALAGGLITAAVCDHRVAVADRARFGLNEVPIDIDMRDGSTVAAAGSEDGSGVGACRIGASVQGGLIPPSALPPAVRAPGRW
jgi:hypothetical protein